MAKTIDMIPRGREFDRFIDEQNLRLLAYLRGKFELDADDLADICQDSAIALYNNIHSGKLNKLTASLATYYFQIADNLAHKFIRDRKPNVSLDDYTAFMPGKEYSQDKMDELIGICSDDDEDPYAKYGALVRKLVNAMTNQCRNLLWGFYRDRLSMKDLALINNFSSEAVAKTTKSRCLSKFKDAFLKLM